MMSFKYWIIIALTVGYLTVGCNGRQTKRPEKKEQKHFVLPEIPKILTSQEDRNTFLALHFWDSWDFTDTSLHRQVDFMEQNFAGFAKVLKQLPIDEAVSSMKQMLDKISGADSIVFGFFIGMTEKYFYNPNSPYRNEEYYIPVLEFILANQKVSELDKTRPRYQLEMALKNRPGRMATDFTFTTQDGKKKRLYDVKAKYTILFFNNPDCHDCERVKELLKNNVTAILHPEVKIIAIYPDEELESWRKTEYPREWINGYDQEQMINRKQTYDLKAIPCLYLLDKDKKVILKDAPVEVIIYSL